MDSTEEMHATQRANDWYRAALSCVKKCLKNDCTFPPDHIEYIMERIRRGDSEMQSLGKKWDPMSVW